MDKREAARRRRRNWPQWPVYEEEKKTGIRAGYEKLVDRPQVQIQTKLRPAG